MEMLMLWTHMDAQKVTGAHSVKREAAEIKTYVMREEVVAVNGFAISVCQRLSYTRIDV